MSLFTSSTSTAAAASTNKEVNVANFILSDTVKTPEESVKPKTRRSKTEAIAASKEELKRTVFVGNLPLECAILPKAQEKFKKYLKENVGEVESIRFRRLLTFKDDQVMGRPDMLLLRKSRKLREKALEAEKGSSNAYVVFAKEESVEKSLTLNSSLFQEHHLRFDRADAPSVPSHKKCIFVGNLALDAEDEDVWKAFESLPQFKLTQVRIIRDKATNRGKGFAYFAFADRAMVRLALDMFSEADPLKIKNRPVRISKCVQPNTNYKSNNINSASSSFNSNNKSYNKTLSSMRGRSKNK